MEFGEIAEKDDTRKKTKTTSTSSTILRQSIEVEATTQQRRASDRSDATNGSNEPWLTSTEVTTYDRDIRDNDHNSNDTPSNLAAMAPNLKSNSAASSSGSATQAQPATAKSFVSTPSTSGRSSTEILRIAASISSSRSTRNSSISAQPNNDVITFTTDVENNNSRSADTSRSLTIELINTNGTTNLDDRVSSIDEHRNTPPPTVFYSSRRDFDSYRNSGSRRSGFRRVLLACCCGVDQQVASSADDVTNPNRHSAPPSYSTIVQTQERELTTPRIIPYTTSSVVRPVILLRENNSNHNQSSFVAHTPPPSYAQAQGICVAYSLERLVRNSTSNGQLWSPRSTTAVCPRCATLVFTFVESRMSSATHAAALALCLMGCWPCCLLPYCIDTCRKAHHYCPFCRTYLGTYLPW